MELVETIRTKVHITDQASTCLFPILFHKDLNFLLALVEVITPLVITVLATRIVCRRHKRVKGSVQTTCKEVWSLHPRLSEPFLLQKLRVGESTCSFIHWWLRLSHAMRSHIECGPCSWLLFVFNTVIQYFPPHSADFAIPKFMQFWACGTN